jgi:hypothetical protein
MNVVEANEIVSKLLVYKGTAMIPFLATVKDLVVVPAGQKEFDLMFKDIIDDQTPLELALQPYENDVTVLVTFDRPISKEGGTYCDYTRFLSGNDIRL